MDPVGLPDKLCTVYLVRDDGLYRARFKLPGDIRDGLHAGHWPCWQGTLRYLENQLARHLAEGR